MREKGERSNKCIF